ncbi:MAG: DnaA regulatory inactivator Hda [Gammaproteobacteria bacterium]|nr:DnaA regulatory inactivator Hda [Gammaproteobacteria bacterium]
MLQLDLIDLGIKPLIKHTFENFVVSEQNAQIVAHLKYLLKTPGANYLYLWGPAGVGKSHLLQAVCEETINKNFTANYYGFKNNFKTNFDIVNILENLELQDVICLDDIDLIAGNYVAEEQLFSFYNRIKDLNKTLIISGNCSILNTKILLPDLKSRLSSGVSYHLKALDDSDKKRLLQTRAHERGMTLTEELAEYLITHGRRDITGLFDMLDRLDRASMRYKRKLSIPFAKEILFTDT